jgi:hypothetical protein
MIWFIFGRLFICNRFFVCICNLIFDSNLIRFVINLYFRALCGSFSYFFIHHVEFFFVSTLFDCSSFCFIRKIIVLVHAISEIMRFHYYIICVYKHKSFIIYFKKRTAFCFIFFFFSLPYSFYFSYKWVEGKSKNN